jgi:hypothetical protein
VESNLESGSLLPLIHEHALSGNPALHILAAALAELTIVNRKSEVVNRNDPYSPWKNPGGFRIGGNHG